MYRLVSNFALIAGMDGGTASGSRVVVLAGLAGLVAGSFSMAAGEYTSVASQRELALAEIEVERREIAEHESAEEDELAGRYRAKGIDPRSLFSGPASRARKYASEELLRWWQSNPRMTLTEFRAMWLGRDSDRKAAKQIRAGGAGREFGV